jgi:hypothetical protein
MCVSLGVEPHGLDGAVGPSCLVQGLDRHGQMAHQGQDLAAGQDIP